jgi:hypothetical protein
MMLDFICELERVMVKWPENASWTLAQIADGTGTGVPQVVDFLSDTLDRELEVHESLTHAEAAQALATLKDRMSVELAARQRRLEQRREKAIRTYDVTMEKVRVLQSAKNIRAAYRTLSYYVGCHEKDLPEELLLSLCGECLRLGIKSDANLQELSQWLRKGVTACINLGTTQSTEDALDFLDAYGDHFVGAASDGAGSGRRLIGAVLETVKQQALNHNLIPRYDVLMKELRLA